MSAEEDAPKIVAHSFPVTRTARFYQIGKPGPKIHTYWLVCHGYGQQAQHFIRKFRHLGEEHLIVAPEGLSRFYVGGVSGPVGASWMTKEDRQSEIEDYVRYLSALHQQLLDQLPRDVQVILLGFSQGCATHTRWVMRTHPHYDRLILWGGLLPEDIDYQADPENPVTRKGVEFVYGTSDPYLNDERLRLQQALARRNRIPVRTHTFDGVHTVDAIVLGDLYEQYWKE